MTSTPDGPVRPDVESAVAAPATTDVAREQAGAVLNTAATAAQRVGGVARDQAGQVAAETGRQVRQLAGQARSQLTDQAQSQQQRAAAGLRSVGSQLAAMAQGTGSPGVVADLADQAADRVHQVAAWLGNGDPASLLADLRSLGRRRPGTFLAVALGAGVLAGRLARGAAAAGTAGTAAGARPPRAAVSPARPERARIEPDRPKPAQPELAPPTPDHPAVELPAALDGDLYGTGLVPDWTGKTKDDLDSL